MANAPERAGGDAVEQALAIADELAALADPEYAATMGWFFKTGPGGYGEGDRFLGIKVPQVRKVARRHRDASTATCERLLASPIHEHRLAALVILRLRFERRGAGREERDAIADLYLGARDGVNNWDLVDASAPYLLADRVRCEPRGLLDPLASSPRLWDRRIAVLATFSLIRAGEHAETLRMAERLLDDREDLIHKAVGWMLREVGKRDESALLGFLDEHAARMPRTMLRYAIERLPVAARRRLMSA